MESLGWLVVVGLLVAAVISGVVIWKMVPRREPRPRKRPTKPEHRLMVLQKGILLGVEMCRVDGAIGEQEIAAVRAYLLDQSSLPDEVNAAWIEEAMNKAMRATMTNDVVRKAARTIRRRADAHDRQLVLGLLIAIATADGELTDEERAWFTRAAVKMGLGEDDLERWL